MKKQIKNGISLLGSLILVIIIITGCEKDKDKDNFQLPPESSFIMDVSIFNNSAKSTENTSEGTKFNVAVAALSTAYWNTAIAIVMAVPVASFKEAFKHDPVRVTNEQWKWSYNVTVNDTLYTAELTGTILENSNIKWEMHISKEAGFQNFLWYEGVCNQTRTEGYWTLYESPVNPVELLDIDWEYNFELKTGNIRYTCVKESADEEGDYIYYGVTDETDYNVFYDISDYSESNLVKIKYNTTTHEGRIFYTQIWHCWDNNLYDVVCE